MKVVRIRLCALAAIVLASLAMPAHTRTAPIDATPLPFSDKRLPASAEECGVWKRELSFARVAIGGEATIAVSRGTFILQRMEGDVPSFRVGMFQTVWVRDAVWRVLDGGSATTSLPMRDRVVAERRVTDQPMSDCA